MNSQLAPLAAIFDINTDLLLNCIGDLSDTEARRCLDGGGNNVAFLAAHLTDTRHFLVERLGDSLANPLAPYLADARSTRGHSRMADAGGDPDRVAIRQPALA